MRGVNAVSNSKPSSIPDTIKKYRQPNWEIQKQKGHYYVTLVKSVYNKELKRSERETLGCIGQIYENIGFVPNKNHAEKSVDISREYGATRIIMEISKDLYETLRKCFPSDFLRIYVLSVLKLLGNTRIKNMDVEYEKSAISVMLPEQHLSKNTLPVFLSYLGGMRGEMLRFMKEFTKHEGENIIFDGSSFLSASDSNPFASKGYCAGKRNEKQIRLIYAFNRNEKMPTYFRVLPGNISDKSSFAACIDEIGAENYTVILDKGFNSGKNIKMLLETERNMKFIMPMNANSREFEESDYMYDSYEKESNTFLYHRRIIFYKERVSKVYKGCKIYIFYDNERRKDLLENYWKRHSDHEGNLKPEYEKEFLTATKMMGVSILLSNTGDTPVNIYHSYKTRWAIEEMFDHHKNTLNFEMQYETKYDEQEGLSFIEFLSLQMFYKISQLLVSSNLQGDLSVKDLLLRAQTITQVRLAGKWQIYNVTENIKNIYTALGITLEPIP
jgi:hypothetical protein